MAVRFYADAVHAMHPKMCRRFSKVNCVFYIKAKNIMHRYSTCDYTSSTQSYANIKA